MLATGIRIRESLRGGYGKYLSRDKTGIQREVLILFVNTRSLSIAELVGKLKTKFTVTFQAIASMVGTIASRIGILSATRTCGGIHNYRLKEKYVSIVVGNL